MSRDTARPRLAAMAPFADEDEDLVMAALDLDTHGRVIGLNRAARHVFGMTAGRDVPVLLATFLQPAHVSRFYRALAEVEHERVSRSVTVTMRPPGAPAFHARLDIDAYLEHARPLCRVTIVTLSRSADESTVLE